MSQPVLSSGRWIIVFFDAGNRRWWDIFTRPGFRHCLALRYLEPMDAWASVDWGNEGLFVDFVPKRFVDALILGVDDCGGAFLEFDAMPAQRRLLPPFFPYCVTTMKHILGIRDFTIITPWQLYCALRKKGAKTIFGMKTEEIADGRHIGRQAESTSAGS